MDKKVIQKFGKHYLLGLDHEGKKVWLSAPSWDCGWYWGFGYINGYTNEARPTNSRDITYHMHWNSSLVGKCDDYNRNGGDNRHYFHHINEENHPVFAETVLTESEAWRLSELMGKYYKLRDVADMLLNSEGEGSKFRTWINETALPEIFAEIDKLLSPKA